MYGPERVRQLRLLLRVVLGTAVLPGRDEDPPDRTPDRLPG